jgi:hypothetical protein
VSGHRVAPVVLGQHTLGQRQDREAGFRGIRACRVALGHAAAQRGRGCAAIRDRERHAEFCCQGFEAASLGAAQEGRVHDHWVARQQRVAGAGAQSLESLPGCLRAVDVEPKGDGSRQRIEAIQALALHVRPHADSARGTQQLQGNAGFSRARQAVRDHQAGALLRLRGQPHRAGQVVGPGLATIGTAEA